MSEPNPVTFMKLPYSAVVFAAVLVAFVAEAKTPKPENYEKIKALYEKFAGASFGASPQLSAKEDALVAVGPAAIPALAVLFRERTDPYERDTLLAVLTRITGDKAPMVQAVTEAFEAEVSKWDGAAWVMHGFGLLTKEEPAKARQIARRILRADTGRTNAYLAMDALERLGEPEDIKLLEAWTARKRGVPQNAIIVQRAEKVKQAVEKRVKAKGREK